MDLEKMWAWFLLAGCAGGFLLAACGGGQAVKTVNVDRVTTNTVAIPKTALCPKPEDAPVLPTIVLAPENGTTDQLSAASAANAESFARYGQAMAIQIEKCKQGVK